MTNPYDDKEETTPPSESNGDLVWIDPDDATPLSELDREQVWREWGIDLQDATRMPDDPEWAEECLWRWRGGEYIRALRHNRPAPGDLERLESIAAGHGDPTGRENPDPLPDGCRGDMAWECIDWSEPPLAPVQLLPGPQGRFWERRRLARLKRSWLDRENYRAYHGPREWHTHIIGQYVPTTETTERVRRAVPVVGILLLAGAGVLMGRRRS